MAQAKQEEQHLNYVSAPFQLIWICVTSFVIFLLIYWPYQAYSPLEAAPQLETFTPKKLISLGAPTDVDVGMYIKDFAGVDVEGGSLTIDALVWFIFDPTYISFDRISKFSFANGTIVKPDEIAKRKAQAGTRILDDKHMIARFDIRVEFALPLQYNLFPLDDHYMPLILVNDFASPQQLQFNALRENLVVSSSLEAHGWRQFDTDVRAGYKKHVAKQNEEDMTTYSPQVVFSMNYKRVGIRHILSILLPLALMFFVSLFAFSFDVELRVISTTLSGIALPTCDTIPARLAPSGIRRTLRQHQQHTTSCHRPGL